MSSHIALDPETLTQVNQKLHAASDELENLRHRLNAAWGSLDQGGARMGDVAQRVQNVDATFGHVASQLEALQTRLTHAAKRFSDADDTSRTRLAQVGESFSSTLSLLRNASHNSGGYLGLMGHKQHIDAAVRLGHLLGSGPSLQFTRIHASVGPESVVAVRSGDTLTWIAHDHGVSLQALEKANPQIKDPNLIFPGQTIHLPGAAHHDPGAAPLGFHEEHPSQWTPPHPTHTVHTSEPLPAPVHHSGGAHAPPSHSSKNENAVAVSQGALGRRLDADPLLAPVPHPAHHDDRRGESATKRAID